MTRRSLATILVFCLVVVLGTVAAVLPVPYVTMSPGPTVNVLGDSDDKPIIDVGGHKTYPTDGDLRLTTVSVTNPNTKVGLADVMSAWFDGARAVYPRDVIYPPEQSAEDVETQSAVEMVSSQDTAIAAALSELGYRLPLRVEVVAVTKGSPADGQLEVRDRLVSINGTPITDVEQVSAAIQRTGVGATANLVVRRGSKTVDVPVKPEASPDDPKKAAVGIQIQPGYDFPFDVSVRLNDDIGGPSAGLIFSLGVYDTLTPGSLTGGTDIAGTGTITAKGRVGPIGGIQQKIVAAADAGAKIFLVPPDNCDSALDADVTKDEIKLVKAPTMHSAVESLQAYARDSSADLPGVSMSDEVDVVLRAAVREIEAHASEAGWDQPARLYGLVPTSDLLVREPVLAAAMGLEEANAAGSLTPIEQDDVPVDTPLESVLETIMWPAEVFGCAAVVERIVLPPGADAQLPDDPRSAEQYAAEHPERQEVRIVAGATRDGSTYCALRMRAHDDAHSVLESPDLVPALLELVRSTLEN